MYKRRRTACPHCGKGLSYSGLRDHLPICQKINSLKCDKVFVDVTEAQSSSELASESYTDISELTNAFDNNTNQCDQENSSLDEASCNLLKIIEMKKLEKEDIDFFELPESDHETETESPPPVEPPIETWDDSRQDIDQDFRENDKLQQVNINLNQSGAPDNKYPVLITWLMLFLTSWQSNFSISDTALTMLIKFLFQFFYIIGTCETSMESLARLFPNSLYKVKKAMGLLEDDFKKYVVCPKCKSIYDYDDCFEIRSGRKVSAKCKFVAWPNHPHRSRRGPCGEFLLKMARTGEGAILYPRMVYPYHSLVKGLQNLLKRPDFWTKCQKWRNVIVPENVKADVYHGKVWQDLATNGFLAKPNSLGLMLNVDWFKPHKHSPGSVGVMYLVVMDLPRQERYRIENVLIVGILPGPSEPKLTANTFLEPLVKELEELWNQDHRFIVHGSFLPKKLKVGLLCVSCDIPASRKIGGFLGHMANQGCSRCKKEFFKEGNLDFSGFSREEWASRVSDEHKKQAKESMLQTTPTGQQAFCSRTGVRYSVLQNLEYFDSIKYFVIDPMHNLYLGTAKHIMKNIWLSEDKPLLKTEDFEAIQKKVDSTIVPQDIGRIPGKIENSFAGFTADQWMSWVLIYSIPSLQGILPRDHLECWTYFVNACKFLGKKVILDEDISVGDEFMIKFLNKFVSLYGSKSVTPNMHLHCHLRECLTDYGPFHGYWCFSFERYNGILGAYHTNNRSIEVQLMRKFQNQGKSKVNTFPDMFAEEFGKFFSDTYSERSIKATLDPVESLFAFQEQRNVDIDNLDCADWSDKTFLECHPPLKDATLDEDDVTYLKEVYSKLLGVRTEMLTIPFTICQFASAKIGSVVYGSNLSRTLRNAYIFANWAGNEGRLISTESRDSKVGEISYFFRHRVKVKYPSSHIYFMFYMARVNWHPKHPSERLHGDLLKLFINDIDVFGPSSFIPLQRIESRAAVVPSLHQGENILMVTTLPGN